MLVPIKKNDDSLNRTFYSSFSLPSLNTEWSRFFFWVKCYYCLFVGNRSISLQSIIVQKYFTLLWVIYWKLYLTKLLKFHNVLSWNVWQCPIHDKFPTLWLCLTLEYFSFDSLLLQLYVKSRITMIWTLITRYIHFPPAFFHLTFSVKTRVEYTNK